MRASVNRAMLRRATVLAVAIGGLAASPAAQASDGPSMVAPGSSGGEAPPSSPWSAPDSVAPLLDGEELPGPAARESGDPRVGDWLLSDETLVDAPSWYQPDYWFGPSPWDSGIELGINGSTGSNESFSLRAGGYTKRESRFSKLDFSAYHNRTTTSGLTTQNNATMDIRNDWLLDESSPWTLFAKGNLFYDEFQTFDVQTNVSSGIGYRFLRTPSLNLTGRVGGGAKREFGGLDDDWVPEALFGFEYEHKIAGSQKLYCKFEYYPEFEAFDQYRMVTDAGWEIALISPSNVSLKLSATDRYDSTPNGANPHLVNYSILLLIKL